MSYLRLNSLSEKGSLLSDTPLHYILAQSHLDIQGIRHRGHYIKNISNNLGSSGLGNDTKVGITALQQLHHIVERLEFREKLGKSAQLSLPIYNHKSDITYIYTAP